MNINSVFGEFPIFRTIKRTQSEEDELKRLYDYKRMSEMYYGNHWDHDRFDNEDLVTVNFCETFVDKLTSFLAGDPWKYEDENQIIKASVLTHLNKMWDNAGREITTYEWCQQSSLYGDSFLLVLRREDGSINPIVVPPMYVFPEWHPENTNEMLSAEIDYIYSVGAKQYRIQYVVDKMNITKYQNGKVVYRDTHGLGRVPLVHLVGRKQVGKWNGRSDIFSIVPVQKHLNDKLTDMSDIIAYHSSPMTFVFGVRLENIEKGADKLITGLPTDADVKNVVFDSDMKGTSDYIHSIKKYMHQLVGVPEIAFGSVDDLRFSNSSGLAIQMLYQPMLDILKVKRHYLTRALREVSEIMLLYAQINFDLSPITDEDIQHIKAVDISFKSPLPVDETANIQNVLAQAEKGVMTHLDMYKQLGKKDPQAYHDKLMAAKENGDLIPYELQAKSNETQNIQNGEETDEKPEARNGRSDSRDSSDPEEGLQREST